MMKHYIFILFTFFNTFIFSQNQLIEIQKKIENLQKSRKVEKYWLKTLKEDQKNNGSLNHSDSIDIINLFKVNLLIEKYGYPTFQEFDSEIYTTPWLVFIHCTSDKLKFKTISIILEAATKKQLPPNFFPNYFVSGFLNDVYNVDMEYDTIFNEGKLSRINICLNDLKSKNNKIYLDSLSSDISTELKLKNLKQINEIGTWNFMQFGTEKISLSIVKLEDQEWYLKNNKFGNYSRLKMLETGKEFKFEYGFNYFTLKIENNKLHYISKNNNKILSSE